MSKVTSGFRDPANPYRGRGVDAGSSVLRVSNRLAHDETQLTTGNTDQSQGVATPVADQRGRSPLALADDRSVRVAYPGGRSTRQAWRTEAPVWTRPAKMTTRLETLGGLRIYRGGQELVALSGRRMQCALLVYLAVERQATRDSVMAIFWPDKDAEKARRSLNNTVYELRGSLGDDWVTAAGNALSIAESVETDVGLLRSALNEERYQEAASLGSGAFLEGCHLADSTAFEHWTARQRSTVRQLQQTAGSAYVQSLYDRGDLAWATAASREWASRAPLDDEAQFWLIRLLAETGHRADALREYERFRGALWDEFEVEPQEGMVGLVSRIREGEVAGLPDSVHRKAGSRVAATEHDPSLEAVDPLGASTPDDAWRPTPGWARKLLKPIGGYVAISAGVLQGVDLLIGYYPSIPSTFFRAALVLLLGGLPIIAATVFFQSQPVHARDLRGARFLVARWFSWRNAMLGGIAATAAWTAALVGWNMVGRLALNDSVVVVPFRVSTSSDDEGRLADELADEITRELNSWDSIRAVPPVSLSGPMFDLGLVGSAIQRTQDGIALARVVRANKMAAIVVDVRSDSAFVSATLFDVLNGRELRQPIEASGNVGDAMALAVPVAHAILGLDTLSIDPERIRRGTANRAALLADVEGERHLAQWHLSEAEERFRAAIFIDPEFGLAHLHLAQSLYWQSARLPRRLTTLGPEIAAASASALEHADGLGFRDRTHIDAFYAFQEGDYDRARDLYHALLARDPTDIYAWLSLGSVEYRDPWLATAGGRPARPRSNLNVALRAFSETRRLQPSFELGYGHLFDIHRDVERVADPGACKAYELPRGQLKAVWDPTGPVPTDARAFCPVLLDSIEWIPRDSLSSTDPVLILRGIDRLLEERLRELRRWSAYAADEPTPREELTTIWLRQRQRLEVAAPSDARTLADSALLYASDALALRSDTLPADLLRLSRLYLAVDDWPRADSVGEEALARLKADDSWSETPPSSGAANLYLASGRPSRALDVVSRLQRRRFQENPDDGSLIPFGGAEAVLDRLGVLGATGIGGDPLNQALDELDRIWSGASYTVRERQLLRESVALRISTALVLDDRRLDAWYEELDLSDPLWLALAQGPRDPIAASEHLKEALGMFPQDLTPAFRVYIQGLAARRAGDHSRSLALLSRLDSIPLRADERIESGWGLRTLSYLTRAKSHEALQDTAAAVASYRRFLQTRMGADTLSAPLYELAEQRLASLSGRSRD